MSETKRGRPAIPEAERRQQIGVRTSPGLKSDLERAAAENGRSVAQEAELRLVDSFESERRAGGVETAHLLRMMADQIAMIERATGKRWHRDLTTWAAVAEAIAKGPIQQLRPDRTTDDEVANEAWDQLWQIMQEKSGHIERLRGGGLHASRQPEPTVAGASDALGSYVDTKRTALRLAVEALQISDAERDQLRMALAALIVLDAAEADAEKKFHAAIDPYIQAEKRGQELFAANFSEREARNARMSAARSASYGA